MKDNLKISLLGILFIFLFSFISVKKKAKSTNWINVEYIKCLKNKLPCECEETTMGYFLITLDTNTVSKDFGASFLRFEDNEFFQWEIKRESNKYKIYRNDEDSLYFSGFVTLKKDTLYYFDENNKVSRFIKYPNYKTGKDYQYYKQNIFLLNNSLNNRGYEPLEKLLNQDSLNCNCNKELGKVNLISIDRRSKAWIIEQKKDSVYLFEYTNSSSGKSVPIHIEKKIVKVLKW